MYLLNSVPLNKAKPPTDQSSPKLSYSKQFKRGKFPHLEGPLPFENFIRDHMVQGHPYKSMPKFYIKNSIKIYLNDLLGGSMRGHIQAIFETLDDKFKEIEVDHRWLPEYGYIDIGFPDSASRDTAAKLEFIYNEKQLRVDITRYAHQKAKWVTFNNLPIDKPSQWVKEASITGALYYGSVLECREEGNFKAQCMRPTTLHLLLEAAPIVKSRNSSLP
ncbi:hypothetical protein DSO57_1025219 [Entomophthora muscae]|uniref:Uncharacterized protein n=1 Tax=Entomophthora muscae TaxID=34485 RepID=A0ACC2S4T2_9FUNG|nr:hypothetical protein DSO57_1025219 [Entomophthora muscae]